MKKILDALFSMQLTVILLFLFAISAGTATFIENDFGTTAAKVAVYNATWFDILLGLLAVNLLGSLVVNRMWQKKRYAIFLFHIAFVVILIGAAITRFYGFEGMMHIREGKSGSEIISDRTYITAKLPGSDDIERQQVLMSGSGWHAPDFSVDAPGGDFHIETVDFVPNASVVISQVIDGRPVVSMMVMSASGQQNLVLEQDDIRNVGDITVTFSDVAGPNTVNLLLDNDQLLITAPDTLFVSGMNSQTGDTILPGTKTPFDPMLFYTYKDARLVLRNFEPNGKLRPVPSSSAASGTGLDALVLDVSRNDDSKEVIVWGTKGMAGDYTTAKIDGQTIRLAYGSMAIRLPFSIRLNNFVLERYPGSRSPSSYESDVTLIDSQRNQEFDFRIYMNHILTHRGYRFYQSSYDTDEQGTVLSVNHDALGTTVSYIGYAIMALAMIFSLISRRTRFRKVLNNITETRIKKAKLLGVVLLLVMVAPATGMAATQTTTVRGQQVSVPDADQAADFGRLIVLGASNRLEPVNTLSSQLLRKFSGKSSWEGFNADQVMLGIISQPGVWQNVPLIKVNNKDLAKMLNIRGKYASFSDFFDFSKRNSYRLADLVDKAYQKKAMEQTKFDKEIIKADEKVNVFYLLYSGNYLKLFPKPGAPSEKWFAPTDKVTGVPAPDSNFIKTVVPMYVEALQEAYQTNNYGKADQLVDAIALYQEKYAADILPTETKQNIEILYNKLEIFERLFKFYGLFGLLFLLLLFLNLIFPKMKLRVVNYVIVGILIIAFAFQTFGLAARWYISGHAPLSNGYESMIFIAWATMLAGFLLSRRSNIALAATTVLASLTLFVAHLNWMNPEVTNLVPVLKSVWLTIHVAVITSSYGFLGLGMILGLFNLLLMIFQTRKNLERFNLTIKEISLTAEATMIIGLYMLTIGTFLGGVWANESWGRYWGWDPKETWALVTVLVYAVITHLNYIPGMVGRYLFNALAVLGFSSVLMTYFGVNYYLSGLHSYAAGDPVPIPAFVYYSIATLIVLLIIAYINNTRMEKIMAEREKHIKN